MSNEKYFKTDLKTLPCDKRLTSVMLENVGKIVGCNEVVLLYFIQKTLRNDDNLSQRKIMSLTIQLTKRLEQAMVSTMLAIVMGLEWATVIQQKK